MIHSTIRTSPEILLAELFEEKVLTQEYPINLERICHHYNIDIIEKNYSDKTIGEIQINEDKCTIYYNPLENEFLSRKRFTIAHELGHFFLHRKEGSFVDNQTTMSRHLSYWSIKEAEANDFAARLLMPVKHIIDAIEELLHDESEELTETILVRNLKDKFQVSEIAMKYRLSNLGILD